MEGLVTIINSRDAPDIVSARYPANPKAGYRISSKGRIPYRISGRIFYWTTIFLVKYLINKKNGRTIWFSGQIPDIKKGRIIRPDIRCIPN
jgi:hypothetical protein